MHAVNVGEVYYDSLRVAGSQTADEILNDIGALPIHVIWSLDVPFIRLLGKYKTSFRISYADAFVLALAERENGCIITTDHSEFDAVERTGLARVLWLR